MTARPEVVRKGARLILEKTPKDRQSLMKTSEFLQLLYRLYRSEKEFRGFMLNSTVPKERKLALIKALRDRFGLGEEVDGALEYLLEINALPLFGEISRVYDHEVEKLLKVSRALLVLAGKVEDGQVEKIKQAVRNFTGRDYEFEVVEDPELIGGFLVKTSSFLIDVSVRRNLEALLKS
ncbi:MAG: F0F1 ATP synthase subunit delta [Aquificaceae bacterium]|nr:F0F1 ATP synthase subunit delta [Aquificaceae bacterium]MCX8060411.1 F0F1 ATP synthase subunit delta [Aquificaceae bacterium]MDW8096531.1 F0F1 ATP synthase subunit delta [Aquificaceae bacterium]